MKKFLVILAAVASYQSVTLAAEKCPVLPKKPQEQISYARQNYSTRIQALTNAGYSEKQINDAIIASFAMVGKEQSPAGFDTGSGGGRSNLTYRQATYYKGSDLPSMINNKTKTGCFDFALFAPKVAPANAPLKVASNTRTQGERSPSNLAK